MQAKAREDYEGAWLIDHELSTIGQIVGELQAILQEIRHPECNPYGLRGLRIGRLISRGGMSDADALLYGPVRV